MFGKQRIHLCYCESMHLSPPLVSSPFPLFLVDGCSGVVWDIVTCYCMSRGDVLSG